MAQATAGSHAVVAVKKLQVTTMLPSWTPLFYRDLRVIETPRNSHRPLQSNMYTRNSLLYRTSPLDITSETNAANLETQSLQFVALNQ